MVQDFVKLTAQRILWKNHKTDKSLLNLPDFGKLLVNSALTGKIGHLGFSRWNHPSPYTSQKATSDFDLKCTRTPADLSCMLGQRCREALRNNPQYSLDTGHKMFGSSKYVRLLPLLFPTTFHRPLMLFHQSAARHC